MSSNRQNNFKFSYRPYTIYFRAVVSSHILYNAWNCYSINIAKLTCLLHDNIYRFLVCMYNMNIQVILVTTHYDMLFTCKNIL